MTTQARALVDKLLASDQALLREGADKTLDALLARPLTRFLDDSAIETIVTLVTAAVTEANVERVVQEHIHPGLDRQIARSSANGETLGDLLPPGGDATILAILNKVRLPEAKWAVGVVDAALVRKLVSPVMQDILLRFAKRLPIPGLGGDGPSIPDPLGLGKKLRGATSPLSSVGKGLIGGVDKKLQGIARDFAETATSDVRAALIERLRSDEGRALVAQIAEHASAHLRGVLLADVLREVDSLPRAEVEAFVPALLAHNVARQELQDTVRDELRAVLAVEGQQPLRELLERYGLLAEVQREVPPVLTRIAADVLEDDAMLAWVDKLLAP
ncbi:MAG: hypothetical protein R3B40_19665 [Polyangiales bacterium]|nr:hypothetical protein [Myxococcales bacterium]MCB9660949.1 hypothetical protein [Sandaracinaceae bacterium]